MIRFITQYNVEKGSVKVRSDNNEMEMATVDLSGAKIEKPSYTHTRAVSVKFLDYFSLLAKRRTININKDEFIAVVFNDIFINGSELNEKSIISFYTDIEPDHWPEDKVMSVENLNKIMAEFTESVVSNFIKMLNLDTTLVCEKIEIGPSTFQGQTTTGMKSDAVDLLSYIEFYKNLKRFNTGSRATKALDPLESNESYSIGNRKDKTIFDDIMVKYNKELTKIRSAKFDRFVGVPSAYVLPKSDGIIFANKLLYALYESNMMLSLEAEKVCGLKFNVPSGGRSTAIFRPSLRYRPIIHVIRYKDSDGEYMFPGSDDEHT